MQLTSGVSPTNPLGAAQRSSLVPTSVEEDQDVSANVAKEAAATGSEAAARSRPVEKGGQSDAPRPTARSFEPPTFSVSGEDSATAQAAQNEVKRDESVAKPREADDRRADDDVERAAPRPEAAPAVRAEIDDAEPAPEAAPASHPLADPEPADAAAQTSTPAPSVPAADDDEPEVYDLSAADIVDDTPAAETAAPAAVTETIDADVVPIEPTEEDGDATAVRAESDERAPVAAPRDAPEEVEAPDASGLPATAPVIDVDYGQRLQAQRAYDDGLKLAQNAQNAVSALLAGNGDSTQGGLAGVF